MSLARAADKKPVERRKELRFKISKKVTLKVLHHMSGPSLGKRIDARVVDFSGIGLRLHLPLPVPCGVPVEIYDGHSLILGEVCRCVPSEGGYTAGIRVTPRVAAQVDRRHEERQEVAHTRS